MNRKIPIFDFCGILTLFLSLILLILTTMASEANVVQGNNKFCTDIFKILSRNDGNLMISPFSAHIVLSMAYQGACGDTANTMQKVLNFPKAEIAADQYHNIIAKTYKINSVTLDVANKIYIMEKFKLKQDFNDVIKSKYIAEAEEIDFNYSDNSAQKINDWIKLKTKEKITNLIDSRMLNSDTRLVLVNAIYFKGDWAKKFDKENTKKEPFYLLNGDEIQVDMMHLEAKFRYQENDELNCKILELPYKGNELSMLIFLPNERNGIVQLQEKINDINMSDTTKHMDLLTVNVTLPKFKIETTTPMKSVLSEMGLGIMFSNKANFCKIADNGEELKVSDVIQKAFIEVNEEGSEAAAATAGLVRMRRSLDPEPKYFISNRPFVYTISKENGNILFFGRISVFDKKHVHDEI